jgi:hypothetical protein
VAPHSVFRGMPDLLLMKTNTERSNPKFATTPRRSPSHDDITARAEAIWIERGRPQGADDEIWLEAERLLNLPGAESGLRPAGFKRDSVLADLDELYPGSTGRETTSL